MIMGQEDFGEERLLAFASKYRFIDLPLPQTTQVDDKLFELMQQLDRVEEINPRGQLI